MHNASSNCVSIISSRTDIQRLHWLDSERYAAAGWKRMV
jgi:hypothetical protein